MDNAFELVKLLARGGIILHFEMIGRIARNNGIDLTDRQILSILSRDKRFQRISPGVFYLEGIPAGRHVSQEELDDLQEQGE